MVTRLIIDARPLTRNPKGVGRYAFHICDKIGELLPADWSIFVLVNNTELPIFSNKFRGEFVYLKPSSDLMQGHFIVPKTIKKVKGDLLLKVNESTGWNYGIPFVTVCHDITQLITEAQIDQGLKLNLFRKAIYFIKNYSEIRGLKCSDYVICNSLFIKNAIKSHYGIESNKAALGYCAIDSRFYLSNVPDKIKTLNNYGLDNFILTFATGDLRENFMRIPEIIFLLKQANSSVPFIIAGVNKEKEYFLEFEERLNFYDLEQGSDYIIETFLSEKRFDDLLSLYTTADFYLELSLHEGFGMQLAEAMACGTTCVTTRKGALEEIADTYGVFIENPNDSKHITQTIIEAYKSGSHLRNNSNQVEFTKKYSWDNTVKTIADCLIKTAINLNI
jgi:glycosyltransferase involved in cell wall biosynthesis